MKDGVIKKRRFKLFSSDGAHQPDYPLIIIIFAILVFGLIMLWSASVVVGFQKFGDSYYYIKHQLLYGVIFGAVAFLITSKINYQLWKKYAFPLILISLFFLILVLIPGVGSSFLGARRWIVLGGIFFQPAELCKLTFLIYLAAWLEKKAQHGIENVYYGFLPFVLLLGLIGLLIILQPDMGTLTVIAAIALVVYFIGGAPWKHLIALGLGGAGLFAILIKIAPYRAARLTTFLNPELDPQGVGYHINQALLALGSGGILGLGLGHSRQKFNFLPEPYGDSIFAVIGEELGFILAVVLVAAFMYFMWRGYKIAKNSPDTFSRLMATGIVTWIVFQALVNIGSMVALIPMTGITLPLVSYGSTSLIMVLASLGILVNISKHTRYSIDRTKDYARK